MGRGLCPLTGIAGQWQAADITGASRCRCTARSRLARLRPDRIARAEAACARRRSLWRLTADRASHRRARDASGWERILRARSRLIGLGAHIAAPCPHRLACPIAAPDWCHFARRVARSRLHRLVKHGDVPWEDEKYIYLAASREPVEHPRARIIAPPRSSKGRIELKLCKSGRDERAPVFEGATRSTTKSPAAAIGVMRCKSPQCRSSGSNEITRKIAMVMLKMRKRIGSSSQRRIIAPNADPGTATRDTHTQEDGEHDGERRQDSFAERNKSMTAFTAMTQALGLTH